MGFSQKRLLGAPGNLVLFLSSLLLRVEGRGKWEFVPADQSLAGDEWRVRRSAAFWALCIARGGQKRICSKCQLSLSHGYDKICIKLVGSNLSTALVNLSAVIPCSHYRTAS